MSDSLDDEIKAALGSGSEDIPGFDDIWNRAKSKRRRLRLVSLSAAALVVLVLSVCAQRLKTPKSHEPVSFCAAEAVDDWLLMMNSDFYNEFPSDSLPELNP